MTDTTCQRDGYDAKTQRYRVPVSSTAPVSQTGHTPDSGHGRDDSDMCPDCRCAPNMPHAYGCEEAAQVTDSVSNVAPERPSYEGLADDNPFPEALHAMLDEAANLHDGESMCTVSGYRDPEDGMTDEEADEAFHAAIFADVDEPVNVTSPETTSSADSFSVPFPVQSWVFEALAEVEIDKLHEIIDKFHARIIEVARIRHQDGFVTHGSKMYSWTPERRLDEMLQEVADSIAYLTSGPIA